MTQAHTWQKLDESTIQCRISESMSLKSTTFYLFHFCCHHAQPAATAWTATSIAFFTTKLQQHTTKWLEDLLNTIKSLDCSEKPHDYETSFFLYHTSN